MHRVKLRNRLTFIIMEDIIDMAEEFEEEFEAPALLSTLGGLMTPNIPLGQCPGVPQ